MKTKSYAETTAEHHESRQKHHEDAAASLNDKYSASMRPLSVARIARAHEDAADAHEMAGRYYRKSHEASGNDAAFHMNRAERHADRAESIEDQHRMPMVLRPDSDPNAELMKGFNEE